MPAPLSLSSTPCPLPAIASTASACLPGTSRHPLALATHCRRATARPDRCATLAPPASSLVAARQFLDPRPGLPLPHGLATYGRPLPPAHRRCAWRCIGDGRRLGFAVPL